MRLRPWAGGGDEGPGHRGTGSVGRFVVDELRQRGHTITVVGRSQGEQVEGATYEVLDATNYDRVVETLAGHEAVIHLAAMPSPKPQQDARLFVTNVQGTFNVYEACAVNGIRKVALASSINWLGMRFGSRPVPLRYFPIDEDHPGLRTDAYSFSKELCEDIARYAWDRHRISSVCIRIPAVLEPTEEAAEAFCRQRDEAHLRAMAPDFWSLVDGRDSARAFVLGIEAEYEGCHPLYLNDRVNCFGLSSRELAALCYPEVTEWRAPIEADEALVSCAAAKELLGWEPAFSWAGVAAGAPVPE